MIRINTCHIPKDGPLHLDGKESADILQLSSKPGFLLEPAGDIFYSLDAVLAGQDLLVTGVAEFPLKTECTRCLCEMTVPIRVNKLCLLYEKAVDQEKDITDDVREELLLAIPEYFHCSPDCKGICSGCGADLNHEKCTCSKKKKKNSSQTSASSPWSALDQL